MKPTKWDKVNRKLQMRDIYAAHIERRTGCSPAYVLRHSDQFAMVDRILAHKAQAANLLQYLISIQ